MTIKTEPTTATEIDATAASEPAASPPPSPSPLSSGALPPAKAAGKLRARITRIVIGVVLLIWAGVGVSLFQDYQQVQEATRRNAQNLVRVIEAQVRGQVDGVDVALIAVTNALPALPGRSVPLDPQVHALLKALLSKAAPARAIWVVDAQGNSLHDSDNRPTTYNYAHRAYFTQQRDNPQLGLYVGQPIANDKGVWFVSVSRRITLPDGSFGGVVVAALEPRYFEQVFATVDVGKQGNLTLLSTEFNLIARQPVAEAMRGQNIRSKTVLPTLVAQAPQGVYASHSAVDGVERTFAYRVVQGYPLVVVAGLSQAEVLRPWWTNAVVTLVATTLLTALLAALGWRVLRELGTSRELNLRLRESKQQVDAALKHSMQEQAHHAGMIDSMVDGVISIDTRGRMLSANRRAQTLFGYSEAELLGHNVKMLMPEPYRAEHDGYLHSYQTTRVAKVIGLGRLVQGRRRDGSVFPMDLSVSEVDSGRGLTYVGTVRDVTDRVAAQNALEQANQQLARSNTDLEQFAYAASHDLLEPLRSVAGSVQLLKKRYAGQLDERADTFIAHAVGGVKRMEALISDLLAYSRLSTGPANAAPVDLNAVLATTCDNLQVAIAESGAQVTHDTLPTVQGEAGQLSHLLQNLMANALKFRGDKPAQVHISARQEDRQWVVSVADQGIGIAPQHFERIFGIFKRLHTREEYAGNGIGLALCQRIVERHGGRIWVESEVGQGTTFFFSLPDKGV